MSHNTFGHLFRVTTFGESHGPALGCVVDGCPPLISARARPTSRRTSTGAGPASRASRRSAASPTQVKILSGVFADERTGRQVTTGTPIALLIENVDQRSKDYSEIKDNYRPGHADFTYDVKYGIRDYRGGGRSSARETAARVAAGADRPQGPADGVTIRGALVQMGPHEIDRANWDWDEVAPNPFFCPDAKAAQRSTRTISTACARTGSSIGAVIEIVAEGVPAGPRRADLRQARRRSRRRADVDQRRQGRRDRRRLRAPPTLRGEENADEMRPGNDGAPTVPLEPCRRHSRRHLHRPARRVRASP